MIKEEYSPYKIVHYPDELENMRKERGCTPIQVQLVLTNKCNHRCLCCAYHLDKAPSNESFNITDELNHDKVLEIIDDCSNMGVEAIQLTGGGEPLVYPRFKEVLYEIGCKSSMKVALVTNGDRMDDEVSDMLVKYGSWVRISIDAATPMTYSTLRQVKEKSYYRVLDNIKYLVEERNKAKSDLTIGVGFVVNQYNHGEIYQAVENAKKLGVDNIRISGAFTPMGFSLFEGFYETAKKEARIAKEFFEDNNFVVFNLFDERVKDTQEVQNYDFCPIKEVQAYIGADGNVYTCCTLAYNKKGLVGSIKDKSFKDMWNSWEKRELFTRHNPRKMCKIPCLYKGKNEFINYCIKENPKHVEFI